jgi:asparagine synthase (glutamine-hydrolysing)
MYAFAMWEASTQRLILARDALGIKPLYLARATELGGGWSLIFASEVRAILASRLLGRPRLDPLAVASVVWNGFVAGPPTVVRGVEMLGAGEGRVYDARGGVVPSEVSWEIPAPGVRSTDEGEMREALMESVAAHLISDVPLGVFLSGGIDSSTVANLACQSADSPVHTFTLTFEEEHLNEGAFARRVAQAIGCDHHEVSLTESRFVAGLERALDSLDQPTFEGLNTYYMAHAVREAGLTVALVRTGGDELFGGYTTFGDLPRLHRWARRLGRVPGPVAASATRIAAGLLSPASAAPVLPQTRRAKLPAMVAARGDMVELYQLAYALFSPEFQRAFLSEPPPASEFTSGLPRALAGRLRREIAGRSALGAISILKQRCFLGERLLSAPTPQGWPLRSKSGSPSSTGSSSSGWTGCARRPPLPARRQQAAAQNRPGGDRPGALRVPQERLRPPVRCLDPARPGGRDRRGPPGRAGRRPGRPRRRGDRPPLGRLPGGGTRPLLVAGPGLIRLD